MSREPGNHGIVIPRDRELLERLYWDEGLTLPKIAAMYTVTHKSVERVFKELGIPRRGKGVMAKTACIGCGGGFRLPSHPKDKRSGGYCTGCFRLHRAKLARAYHLAKYDSQSAARAYRRWYESGAVNPIGERQWLNKCKALLRTARRTLRRRGASQSQSAESKLAATSPL